MMGLKAFWRNASFTVFHTRYFSQNTSVRAYGPLRGISETTEAWLTWNHRITFTLLCCWLAVTELWQSTCEDVKHTSVLKHNKNKFMTEEKIDGDDDVKQNSFLIAKLSSFNVVWKMRGGRCWSDIYCVIFHGEAASFCSVTLCSVMPASFLTAQVYTGLGFKNNVEKVIDFSCRCVVLLVKYEKSCIMRYLTMCSVSAQWVSARYIVLWLMRIMYCSYPLTSKLIHWFVKYFAKNHTDG